MDKKVSLKTVSVQFGDAQIRAKVMESGAGELGSTLTNFHSHKQYECHFIEKGFVQIHTEEKVVSLSQSEMLIIPPNLGHFATITNDTFKRHVIGFSLYHTESEDKGVYAFFKKAFETAVCNPVIIGQKLISMVKKFKATLVADANDYINSVALLTNIITGIVDAIKVTDSRKSAIEGMTDFHMLLDICINIPEMSLDEMASTMSYSRRHISRKIREVYGMSLSELRSYRRVQAAKKMLENREYTIEQIALDSGFKSATAMREIFKKYEKVTPSEYRRNVLK